MEYLTVIKIGQDLNPARPGPVKPGRHSLITGPARLRSTAKAQKPKIPTPSAPSAPRAGRLWSAVASFSHLPGRAGF